MAFHIIYFWKLSLVHNMSIIRHQGAEYASCWGATEYLTCTAVRRAFVQKCGQSEEKEIQAFRCLVVRFNGISEMEKANHKSYLHSLEGRSVSAWMYALMHQRKTTASIQVVRGLSPQMYRQKGKHGHPRHPRPPPPPPSSGCSLI